MYCWRPKLGTQEEELFDIIKNGFKNGSEYEVRIFLVENGVDIYF